MSSAMVFVSVCLAALASAMIVYIDSLRQVLQAAGVILIFLILLLVASPVLCRSVAAVLLSVADGADAARRVRREKRDQYLKMFQVKK